MSDQPGNKGAEQEQRVARDMLESAQQIWLAGLGAFSRAQQQGGKLFETLVEEGTQVQEKTRTYTKTQFEQARRTTGPWLDEAKRRTTDAFGKIEQAFDERLARAMRRMQMPSHDDIERLSARIDELAREVRARKPAAKKTTSRK
ncbi:MAG: phasin family protein [Pseudomonadota bacterium]|nr:phasin family protein [Pseudomonadota bacterium]